MQREVELNEELARFEEMSDEELSKEVFAWFGAAAYQGQCFERALIALLLIQHRITNLHEPSEDVDRLENLLSRKTLGSLITELKKTAHITIELENLLLSYKDERNRLAHRFFYENAFKLCSRSGCLELIQELKEKARLLDEADHLIDALRLAFLRAAGVNVEKFEAMAQQTLNRMLANEQKRGIGLPVS